MLKCEQLLTFLQKIMKNRGRCVIINMENSKQSKYKGNCNYKSKLKGADTMAYTAMQIAAEVVRQYRMKKEPITNLKLQKILYYIQVECLQKNDVPAFQDDIEAWRHGPVVRDVYNTFCVYIANPIEDDDPDVEQNLVKIDDKTSKCISDIVERSIRYDDPWDLVYRSHETKPWRDTFIPDANCIITKDSLKNDGTINI